jgi:hypothetical protein
MMTLVEDKHAPIKNNLLYVRFGSACTHTINTLPNIQAWGLHIPGEVPPPTAMMGQDNNWQEAMSPRLMAACCRTVQGVG